MKKKKLERLKRNRHKIAEDFMTGEPAIIRENVLDLFQFLAFIILENEGNCGVELTFEAIDEAYYISTGIDLSEFMNSNNKFKPKNMIYQNYKNKSTKQ